MNLQKEYSLFHVHDLLIFGESCIAACDWPIFLDFYDMLLWRMSEIDCYRNLKLDEQLIWSLFFIFHWMFMSLVLYTYNSLKNENTRFIFLFGWNKNYGWLKWGSKIWSHIWDDEMSHTLLLMKVMTTVYGKTFNPLCEVCHLYYSAPWSSIKTFSTLLLFHFQFPKYCWLVSCETWIPLCYSYLS